MIRLTDFRKYVETGEVPPDATATEIADLEKFKEISAQGMPYVFRSAKAASDLYARFVAESEDGKMRQIASRYPRNGRTREDFMGFLRDAMNLPTTTPAEVTNIARLLRYMRGHGSLFAPNSEGTP